jgi:predicted helicase
MMLKHTDILAKPKMYHDLYDAWSQKTSGQTINNWIADVETLASTMPDTDSALKLRGDMLEVLSELFFNCFQADEAVGLKDYCPVVLGEDFGVDAIGKNANGTKVAVQCKYKNLEPVTYSELAKTFTSGLLNLQCDMLNSNSIYVFTTAFSFSSAVDKVLGGKVVKIDRNVISRKIDNNRTFWQYAYDQIFETLDQ